MTTESQHAHIDTADLVRLLDGQLGHEERRGAEKTLAECGVCRRSADRIRQRTTRLSALLTDTDWQAPPAAEALARIQAAAAHARATRPSTARAEATVRDIGTAPRRAPVWTRAARLRLAAGIAVIIAGAALVATPAAAWIAHAAERAWSAIIGEPAATAPVGQPPGAATEQAQRTYEYVPDAGVLSVHFTAGSRGTLHVESTDDSALELTATGGDAPGIVLLPSEVRIDTGADDQGSAQYSLSVPRQIDAVRVHIGDRAPMVLTKQRIGAGMSLELGAAR